MDVPANLPSDEALRGLMDELDKAMTNLPDTQQQLMSLSGVAWSDDRMVKVEVGPRGQLVDLEIDPRVFRKPDARALRASILAATRAAVQQVADKTQEIVLGQIPPEVAELRSQFRADSTDPMAQMLLTDAELAARRSRGDG